MKKIIALAFLVLALSALDLEISHQQAKPAATPAPAANNKPHAPTTTPAPVKIQRSPHKEPGNEATPGNPYGRDPQGHKTCFTPPCYDPVGACTIAAPPAKPAPKTAVKTTTQAPVVAPKQGVWKAILYIVRVNGKRARFGGYRCA